MRLTRLEIENFKGIGERQVIEISPITLLFGPNSAGKSSILQAVEYLHQILQGNLLDIDEISAMKVGEGWGDFKSLVHCHDLRRVIKIKANVKLNENFYDEYFPINLVAQKDSLPLQLSKSLGDAKFSGLPINYIVGGKQSSKVTDVSVLVEVAWQDKPILPIPYPFLRSLEIEINNQQILTIKPQQNSILTNKEAVVQVNHAHYLLNSIDSGSDSELESQSNIYHIEEKKRKWHIDDNREIEAKDDKDAEHDSENQNLISPFSREILEVIHEVNPESGRADSKFGDKLPIFEFDLSSLVNYSFYSDTSDINQTSEIDDISFPLRLVAKKSSIGGGRLLRLQSIFAELISGPVRSVFDATETSHASWLFPSSKIGPLRSIPPRGKSGTVLDTTHDLGLIQSVNHWLKDRLELDYTIERFRLKLESEAATSNENNEEEPAEIESDKNIDLSESLSNLHLQDRMIVKLYDRRRKIYLDFKDVGVGMSQLVPVLVAALFEANYGLVRIEQPELHLHPAIQVELGDLFIESAQEQDSMERVFLIETHSEHLLLRLLRRIQQTTDDELPPDAIGLQSEDLSIIYVEPFRTKKSIKTRIKRLRVDNTGEFVDRWPNGFFDERYGELF